MVYCTAGDMVELFEEEEMLYLTNLHDASAVEIDPVRIGKAIAYAEAEVNSYLQRQYTLPLASIPFVLTNKVADIARYQLDSIQPRDDVRKRYEDAVKWLQLLALGKVDLGLDQTLQPDPISIGGSPQSYAPDRIFTMETLRGF